MIQWFKDRLGKVVLVKIKDRDAVLTAYVVAISDLKRFVCFGETAAYNVNSGLVFSIDSIESYDEVTPPRIVTP